MLYSLNNTTNIILQYVKRIYLEFGKIIICFVVTGFIDFIVDPSLTVCSDMLEAILGPIMGPTKEVKRSVSVSEDTRKQHGQSTSLLKL